MNIQKIDHVGIRIREKQRSIAFYRQLGFALISDTGFEQGHPIILEHPSGVVLNLLGPATSEQSGNVLMDGDIKPPGYTHMALRVSSLDDARKFLNGANIEITGGFEFKGLRALFIRDPDRSVIEFDEYAGDEPETRRTSSDRAAPYPEHP